MKSEADCIFRELAELLEAAQPPSSREGMDLAERHRLHIEKWFYRCPRSMHAGIGELYVIDPRFTEGLERFGAGLAGYARSVWKANAGRKGDESV